MTIQVATRSEEIRHMCRAMGYLHLFGGPVEYWGVSGFGPDESLWTEEVYRVHGLVQAAAEAGVGVDVGQSRRHRGDRRGQE